MKKSTESVNYFTGALNNALETQGAAGLCVGVYAPGEYVEMRLFLFPDGGGGFGLKADGELVSVFINRKLSLDPGDGKRSHQLLVLSVLCGATKLDAFNTVLPAFYNLFGFFPVCRLAWDDEFKPENWDFGFMGKFNAGKPDIVYMVYNGGPVRKIGEKAGSFSTPESFKKMMDNLKIAASVEHAKSIQTDYLNSIASE